MNVDIYSGAVAGHNHVSDVERKIGASPILGAKYGQEGYEKDCCPNPEIEPDLTMTSWICQNCFTKSKDTNCDSENF
jgi:hypothetical protein